jgi:hypothetical protein
VEARIQLFDDLPSTLCSLHVLDDLRQLPAGVETTLVATGQQKVLDPASSRS